MNKIPIDDRVPKNFGKVRRLRGPEQDGPGLFAETQSSGLRPSPATCSIW